MDQQIKNPPNNAEVMKKVKKKKKKRKKSRVSSDQSSAGLSIIDKLFDKLEEKETSLDSNNKNRNIQKERESKCDEKRSDTDESTAESSEDEKVDDEKQPETKEDSEQKVEKLENEDVSSSDVTKIDSFESKKIDDEIEKNVNLDDTSSSKNNKPSANESDEQILDPESQNEKVELRIPKKSRKIEEQSDKPSLIKNMPRKTESTTKNNYHGFNIDLDDDEDEEEEEEDEDEVSYEHVVENELENELENDMEIDVESDAENDAESQNEKVELRIPKKTRKIEEQSDKPSLIKNMPRKTETTTKNSHHGFNIDLDDDEEEEEDEDKNENENEVSYENDAENDMEIDVENDVENDSENDSQNDAENDVDNEISINNIVRETLGRSIRASTQIALEMEDKSFSALDTNILANATESEGDCKSEIMKDELTCPICHEIYYCPVSMICGHSFCKECLNWWITKSSNKRQNFHRGQVSSSMYDNSNQQKQQHFNCPTCRKNLMCDPSTIGINTVLRACVTFLFVDQIKDRARRQKEIMDKLTRGENDGAHLKGYQVLQEIDDNDMGWTKVKCFPKDKKNSLRVKEILVKRNVLMDEQDQRMCLSLAVYYLDVKKVDNNYLTLELCLITMEEDEADEGIPYTLDNEDDSHFIANEERFETVVEMKGTSAASNVNHEKNSNNQQLEHESVVSSKMQQGAVVFDIDLSCHEESSPLSFIHSETGAQLKILLPLSFQNNQDGCSVSSVDNEFENDYVSEHDEELDYYENDGFLVDDNDASIESNEDGNNDNICCICHDGGELIVCDGGENIIACGKAFHIPCINRSEIPEGDWVCKDCAAKNNFTVGIEGYEFPPTNTQSENEECEFSSNGEEDSATMDESNVSKRKISDMEGQILDSSDDDSAILSMGKAKKDNKGVVLALLDSDDDEPTFSNAKRKRIKQIED